jgi:uncharacterized protein (TIGR02246 family)
MHPDEQAIRDLVATWDRASRAGDIDALAPLMAEDVVYLVSGKPPMRGRETFLALARSMQGGGTFEASGEFEEIRLMGDWAYAIRNLRVAVTHDGAATVRLAGPVLSIFRREPSGGWVLARDANLLVKVDGGSL